MTFKEFVDSLAVLEIGASVVLTRQQFDTVFAGVQHEADRKQVARGGVPGRREAAGQRLR